MARGLLLCRRPSYETRKSKKLEFIGEHHKRCHDVGMMNARKSAPGVGSYEPYSSSDGSADDGESGMTVLDFSKSVQCFMLYVHKIRPVLFCMSCVVKDNSDAISDPLC